MQKITNPLLVMSNWKKEKIDKNKRYWKEVREAILIVMVVFPLMWAFFVLYFITFQ